MSNPMRTGRLPRPVPLLALLAAGILGTDGAIFPAGAQYPSNFEPYNAYYYSLHAPYYYYIAPEPAPVPSRTAPAAGPPPWIWNWGWRGGGWGPRWGWRGGHR